MNNNVLRNDVIQKLLSFDDNYCSQTKSWIKYMVKTGSSIDHHGIYQYFKWLNEDSGLSAGTIKNRMSCVKNRIKKLYKNKSLEEKIKIKIMLDELQEDFTTKMPSIYDGPIENDRIVTEYDFEKLLSSCHSDRQKLFVMIFWETGLKVSELCRIKIKDCKIENEIINIRIEGAFKKERHIRIRKKLYDYCKSTFQGNTYLLETSGGKPYRREYISSQIHTISKRIGLDIRSQILRHSFGYRKIKEYPEKVDAVSRYLGHSSVSNTMNMYCKNKLTNDELFDDIYKN